MKIIFAYLSSFFFQVHLFLPIPLNNGAGWKFICGWCFQHRKTTINNNNNICMFFPYTGLICLSAITQFHGSYETVSTVGSSSNEKS